MCGVHSLSSKFTSVVKMAIVTKKQRPSTVSSGELDYDNRTLCGENDFDSGKLFTCSISELMLFFLLNEIILCIVH